MARRKAQNPYGSCLAARGRLPARQSRRFAGNGPCFRPVRRASNAPTDPSASSWQGLLVAPEGAPMPPECLVATRPAGAAPRPASRRLIETPLTGRGGGIISEVRRRGLCGDNSPTLVIPAKAGIQGQEAREPAALDTGFRRYDGVRCLLRERQSPLPLWESGVFAEARRVDPIGPMPSLPACRRRRSRRRAPCARGRSRCRASWLCASGRYAHRRCAHRHRRCGPIRRRAIARG